MRLVIDLQGAQGGNRDRGIGRYARELALAMARAPRGHEVVLALSAAMPDAAAELTESFSPLLGRDAVRLWHPPRGEAGTVADPSLRAAAELLRARFLHALRPDLVHVSSLFEGLGDDAVTTFPTGWERPPVVATCYDLIPLLRPRSYFGPGGVLSAHQDWYYRRVREMAAADGLLAISESSRREAVDHLGFDPERVFNVGAGISGHFRPDRAPGAESAAAVAGRHGLDGSFILFLGAGDARKNEVGLIAAYARLPEAMRQRHRLALVGRMDPAPLRRAAAELGVAEDRLVLLPFVAEADLPALYAACTLFVFPSLHEGFGLPALEAMACGAPVLASGTTSLPEVVGRDDALFDPADPASIAASMARVLGDDALRADLAAWGPRQAARFGWDRSAERAWDGLERLHDALGGALGGAATRPAVPARRPRLAFVSPLPPQATGIADYAADLLPALARHYDVAVVSEVPRDRATDADAPVAPLLRGFPHLDPEGFLREAGDFDRVLYQVGNSHFHRFQLEALMPAVPGVVVLHDGFLSDYHNWAAQVAGVPERFRAELFESHGYPALLLDAREGRDEALRLFSCTGGALGGALAVIHHSEHGRAVSASQLGPEAPPLHVVPLLRWPEVLPERAAARRALGLDAEERVVCSFGMVTPKKQPLELARAWHAAGVGGRLVFVGEATGDLAEAIAALGAEAVRVTGRVGAEEYRAWLAAADLAVQLRRGSRGETSRAVADCFAAGLPLISNRHGSAAELPDEVALLLPDAAPEAAIGDAIAALLDDPARRAAMAAAALAHLRRNLAPDAVARRYRDAIEEAYAARPVPALLRDLGAGGAAGVVSLPAARAVARAVSDTFRPRRPGRVLLDVSEMARGDSGTGIQRVVRELLRRTLAAEGPDGSRHEAVRFRDGRLRRAHAVGTRVLGLAPLPLPEAPVAAGAGDVLFCLDLNPAMAEADFAEVARLRLAGARVVLLVYDTLPAHQPHLFPPGIAVVRAWYERMLSLCDAVLCISRDCADDLLRWLDESPSLRGRPLPVGWFHLGSDLRPASGTALAAPGAEAAAALRRIRGRPSFLMVGTVEPRKGHRQALDAFEALWRDGHDACLVIVGKPGWMVEELLARLQTSPQLGRSLFWLSSCGDDDMRALYAACSALLMASSHEGFGLPIVEAFAAGLPVLARGIPVFREVAGDDALYFEGTSPAVLADAVLEWLALDRDGRAPRPGRPITWDESHARAMRFVLGEAEPYAVWRPGASERLAAE